MKPKYFPFRSIRKGQKEFLEDVSAALEKKENLLAHAPTGIGKTVAVLTPALEHAIKNNQTAFFLTPKHTQHRMAIDTLRRIKDKHDVGFVAVDIVGKQWTCPYLVQDLSSSEFNDFCRKLKKEEACDYYNNVRKNGLSEKAEKTIDLMKKEPMHCERASRVCGEEELCPYEISVEVGRSADIIVCDYFHVFSPGVREAFLTKIAHGLDDTILIVDEAHNLPDRVRGLLSSVLSEKQISRAIKEARYINHEERADDLGSLWDALKEIGYGMGKGEEERVEREKFMHLVEDTTKIDYEDLEQDLLDLGRQVLEIPDRHLSYARGISRFLEKWKGPSLGYARILNKHRYLSLRYKCLDPSLATSEIFKKSGSSILMSGTLLPQEMYSDVLGFEANRTRLREYESPFPTENRLSMIIPDVTTKYSKRSEHMYKKMASHINKISSRIPGNLAVFFSAYHLMNKVHDLLNKDILQKEILLEQRHMNKQEKFGLRKRLENLLKMNRGGLLMGVQAGSLSEGVDYANNLLDAVIIVGLPLEYPDLEVKSLIDYYDFKFERGWDYGYIYPAMNRALQAAGRCIRTETDKGVLVFMDQRFTWKNYSKCFPHGLNLVVTETPGKYIRKFFEK